MYNCPDCNDEFEKGTPFCQSCGCNIQQKFLYNPVCPECIKSFDDGTQFCDDDGTKLTTPDKLVPKCVECGKEFLGDVRFCPDDGGSILTDHQRYGKVHSSQQPASANGSIGDDDYQVTIGEYLSGGLGLLKQNISGYVGFTVLVMVVNIVLSLIPVIGTLISSGVNAPLMAGYFVVAQKQINHEDVEFGDFFKGFDYFLPLFLAGLVSGIFVFVGVLLFLLPGIYLAVSYMFTSLLILNRGYSFFDAMEASRKLITKNWFSFFGFYLLITLINLAGLMLLGFGLLFTLPLTMCAVAIAYHDIVNKQLD